MALRNAINQCHVSEHTKVISHFQLRRSIPGFDTVLRVRGGDELFACGGHPRRGGGLAQVRQYSSGGGPKSMSAQL